MLFFAVALNALTALAYVLLGPVVIPRLLRSFNPRLKWQLHICLGLFFVGCALTHVEIVFHLLDGAEASTVSHHALLAVPQVFGGYAVILFALLDRRWGGGGG